MASGTTGSHPAHPCIPDSGHTAQQGHPHPLLPWPCCGTGAPCHLGRLALGLAAPRPLSIWITATVVRPSTCEIQSALPWSTAESVPPATRSQEGHREGISQFLVCTDPTVPHTAKETLPREPSIEAAPLTTGKYRCTARFMQRLVMAKYRKQLKCPSAAQELEKLHGGSRNLHGGVARSCKQVDNVCELVSSDFRDNPKSDKLQHAKGFL